MRGLINRYNFGGLNFSGGVQYTTVSNINGVAWPRESSTIIWHRFTGGKPAAGVIKGLFTTGNNTNGQKVLQIGITTQSSSPYFVTGQNIRYFGLYYDETSANDNQVSPLITGSMNIEYNTQIHCFGLIDKIDPNNSSNNILYAYLDGALVGQSTSFSTASIARPTQFYTSTQYCSDRLVAGRYPALVLGEGRFLNVALSDSQMKAHWNKGKGSNNLDLLSHLFWHKVNGNGNDSSGNSRPLTHTGSPTYLSF